MSSIRYQRATSLYVPFPGRIVDSTVLDSLGVIAGSRLEENPPKVLMTRSDWGKLLEFPELAKRSIAFSGTTWDTNPLIAPPHGMRRDAAFMAAMPDPSKPLKKKKKKGTPSKPKVHSFAHLRELPLEQAIKLAEQEHLQRVATGKNMEESLKTLSRALKLVKRWAINYVEPRPLPQLEGEDPPTPTELRKGLKSARPLGQD